MSIRERVSIQSGKTNIIFVAPHGYEETNTDVITEDAANAINAYYIINRGWVKGKRYNYLTETANCNDIEHLHEDVVKDEFLSPLMKFVKQIRSKHSRVDIYYIHGANDKVRDKADDPLLSAIVGIGNTTKNAYNYYTCPVWARNQFCYQMTKNSMTCYGSRPDGPYAAAKKNNLCQLYRQWQFDLSVHSMQVEIVKEWRIKEPQYVGEYLALSALETLERDERSCTNFVPDEY